MSHVLLITIDLTLDSRGGVLEPVLDPGREDGPSSRPLHDHEGRATIPGSTLAGSLRAHAATSAGWTEDEVAAWFGTGGDDPVPSRVRCCGILPLTEDEAGAGEPQTAIERSTAIDRERGAAQNRALRTVEVVEKGSRFRAYVRVDEARSGEADAVLDLLSTYRPVFGGGVSTGRGLATASRLKWGRLDLSHDDDLRTWLTRSGPGLFHAVALTEREIEANLAAASRSMTFKLASALHVSSGDRPAPGRQEARAVLRHGDDLVIAGRALKGVFRSRAEYILRSLGIEACAGSGGRGCVARTPLCLTCRIFGAGGNDHAQRAAVRFDDATIEGVTLARRSHVAIDRFTGGAQDRLLYADEVVEEGTFEVRVSSLGDTAVWGLADALLLLVAQDLDDGYVGLGSAVTRGYGWVTWTDRDSEALRAARDRLYEHVTGSGSIEETT